MKVFLLITKAEVGGAQMSVLNLARGLKDRGVEVKVGFGEGEFLPQELKKEGIPYTRFKNLKRTHNPLANLFFIREVKKYFNENDYEVVHINSSNALFAAAGTKLSKNKPKTVFTFRGMSMLDDNYRKTPVLKVFYKLFFQFFLQFVDEPVFVSKHNLELGKKLGLAKKENLVYNGIDKSVQNFYTRQKAQEKLQKLLPLSRPELVEGVRGKLEGISLKNKKPLLNPPLAKGRKYSPPSRPEPVERVKGRKNKTLPLTKGEPEGVASKNTEPLLDPPLVKGRRSKYSPPLQGGVRGGSPFQNHFLIGSIGRLAYQKNYEFLINIFPEILKIKPEAKAVIIGDGPKKEEYEEMIRKRELQDKIILAGSISNASQYLRAFDLFVLPSRYEGLSITLIETLFSGVPVLATDVGGNRETLPSDQEIYGLDDKKEFLDKFQSLISKEIAEKISRQNMEHSKNFTLDKTTQGYQKIYNKKI